MDALDFNSPSGGFNPLYFFQYIIKIETLASAPITAPNVATATEEATEPPNSFETIKLPTKMKTTRAICSTT